ncbi:MAG TPA: aminodeoxychorismate synthase component I, partial [Candidatus Kryptobacter bacterium]|nr:aminodeoxychorismate synthase component I [Candidatus Kryptobacter bacterium]
MDIESSPKAILRDASGGHWLCYTNPQHIITARRIEEVLPALDSIERIANDEGLTAVGFLAYEAAPAFDPALSVRADGEFPLLWFGLFRQPDEFARFPVPASSGQSNFIWQSSVTQDEYRDRVGRIHEYIRSGDTYQVNFSYRMRATVLRDPLALFAELMVGQETQNAAFVDTGEWAILSASPELFFRLKGDHIESKPMKGTAARGLSYQGDCRNAEMLRASEKERAENLMIVDMVRNDIGRVAETGSVKVPSLFTIERYPTVWQMTSTVYGRTKAPLVTIFQALFPPASITGAPKRRAMEIITELESSPRRVYTGAIGWIAPDRRAEFSVAIRTMLLNRKDGCAEYGVGSGIVWDSERDREWEECSLKARILYARMPQFDLLETMTWSPGDGYFLQEYHLLRLEQSAEYFGFKINVSRIRNQLNRVASGLPALSHRVRLLLSRAGSVEVKANPLIPAQSKFGDITIAKTPVDSSDVFLYHKTTNRKTYEEVLKTSPSLDDVILFNEKGEVTETTIANIAVEIDGKMYTPPVSCGLLAGTYRAWLIEQKKVWEKTVSLDELRWSAHVYLMNSVRGIRKVKLITSQ